MSLNITEGREGTGNRSSERELCTEAWGEERVWRVSMEGEEGDQWDEDYERSALRMGLKKGKDTPAIQGQDNTWKYLLSPPLGARYGQVLHDTNSSVSVSHSLWLLLQIVVVR